MEIKKATLINEAGQKQVVESGSQEAQDFFSQGFSLMKPTTDVNITADNLEPETDITLPDEPEPKGTTEDLVAGATAQAKTIKDYIKDFTPEPTEASEEKTDITSILGELTQQTAQKGVEQLEAEKEVGLPDLQQELSAVLGDIDVIGAEYEALKAKSEATPEVGGMRQVFRRQTQLDREKASELGLLYAKSKSLLGQTTQAQAIANRAIDLKYSVIENNIDIYEAQLEAIQDTLDREDTILFNARTQMLADLREQKADEKEAEKLEQEQIIAGRQKLKIEDLAVVGAEAQRLGLNAEDMIIRMPNGDIFKKSPTEIQALKDLGKVETDFTKIGVDKDGNDIYGFVDPITKIVTPIGDITSTGKTITSPSGQAYDMSTYAKDPKQAQSVQNKINAVGKLDTLTDVANYINSQRPNSPILADMVANASEQYGVGWEELLGLMEHESWMGTSPVAEKNNNPGGITWNANFPEDMKGTARPGDEKGNYVKFDTMQNGVNSVAYELSKRKTSIADAERELTPKEKSQAALLARQLYGTIKTADQIREFLVPIQERLAAGESIDVIGDDLRFAGQSVEFTGAIRSAAQQITSNLTAKKTDTIFDKLDDALGTNDPKNVQDYLKKIAIDNAPGGSNQAQKIMGEERTLELVGEIGEDLKEFERLGGDTNIFAGTEQRVKEKIGTVGEAELAKIANKIQIAIVNYRKAISGAAFNELEQIEYREIFPSTTSTAELNSSKIGSLSDVFQGDVDFFYSFSMGRDNYEELFKAEVQEQPTTEPQFNETGQLTGGQTSSGLNYTIEY